MAMIKVWGKDPHYNRSTIQFITPESVKKVYFVYGVVSDNTIWLATYDTPNAKVVVVRASTHYEDFSVFDLVGVRQLLTEEQIKEALGESYNLKKQIGFGVTDPLQNMRERCE